MVGRRWRKFIPFLENNDWHIVKSMIESPHYTIKFNATEYDEDLRVKVAFVHYRLRNQRAFKSNIAKALQINPESSEIYAYMTELWYLKKKDPRDVEFFANKALEFKTKNL